MTGWQKLNWRGKVALLYAVVKLELWHPGRNWRGNVSQWIIYSQAFNSALAIPIASIGVIVGVSGWMKLFELPSRLSLTVGVLLGVVYVLIGPIGGIVWKYLGIWRQQNEAGLLTGSNKPDIMRWQAWVALLKKQGLDPKEVFANDRLPVEVEDALHSTHKRAAEYEP